ncbi:MAG: methyltransferase domain-containing protein [Candidatus Pseudobacter hemicellulosilyticus]|uniref:Methyltransferase domain-containing protein n=1 Tax=Candidatus Pseudobacter hemicellulosilyticus TaxID=3121375 RepID=A0AAJ6BEI6_9BACT|nr:MAG: methyltransferase domain-containing protein [Pseudobacter sp.]
MPVSLHLQQVQRPTYTIELHIPDPQEVQDRYLLEKQVNQHLAFPHWSRLWPSAIALADFIFQHPELVQDKKVLELAAGLGLPAFIAARYAIAVCCSDYLEEAVSTMAASARQLQLTNFRCEVLDWNQLPPDLSADVLLLSDINYDPDQFDQLYQVLVRFLQQGTLILLATPQRLMAKPFVERLLPWCRQQEEMVITQDQQASTVSILLLQSAG